MGSEMCIRDSPSPGANPTLGEFFRRGGSNHLRAEDRTRKNQNRNDDWAPGFHGATFDPCVPAFKRELNERTGSPCGGTARGFLVGNLQSHEGAQVDFRITRCDSAVGHHRGAVTLMEFRDEHEFSVP